MLNKLSGTHGSFRLMGHFFPEKRKFAEKVEIQFGWNDPHPHVILLWIRSWQWLNQYYVPPSRTKNLMSKLNSKPSLTKIYQYIYGLMTMLALFV